MSVQKAELSDIKQWLQPFFAKENLKNPVVTIEGNTEKGDGMLGDIAFVNITAEQNATSKLYNLVIKTGKRDAGIRSLMPIREVYENEICIYTKVFKAMEQLQIDKGIADPFDNTIKCYFSFILKDVEGIVLQNMRSFNYSLWDRYQPMNKEHICEIMKAYGKYHALSFALRDQKPDHLKELADSLCDIPGKLGAGLQKQSMGALREVIEIVRKEGNLKVVKKLEKMASINMPDCVKLDDYAVIVHGDCWNNNFMFKYSDNENTKLEHVCMLDFQISKLTSIIADLGYFIFTCAEPNDLLTSFEEIRQCYYDTFCDFLVKLGSDPKKLFPWAAYLDQWNKYGNLGIIALPTILRMCLAGRDEVQDLTDSQADGNILDVFKYQLKNKSEFERRILLSAEFAAQQGFI